MVDGGDQLAQVAAEPVLQECARAERNHTHAAS
jgi:hypothetical protein